MTPDIAVLTNAQSAGQRSMIGYGELVLEAARRSTADFAEFRATSALSQLLPENAKAARAGKLVRDLERFALSPLFLAGRRADIVHVVDPGNIIYLDVIAHRAAVVTVHDMIPYLCLAGRLEGFRPSRPGRFLMRRIISRLKRVPRIVCVSESTRRDLLSFVNVEPNRITTIPNAIFQPMARAPSEACCALRTELTIPAGSPLLLHIGRGFYKNRRTVLDVFASLHHERPDAHLLYVSPPTPDLVAAVSAKGLTESVHFSPYISRDRMATVYTTASLLIFPSLYEGFGYPVLEAQLCGTPVICANTGSLPEVAGDGARLFASVDVAGMTAAATELLADPAASALLIARGYENARRFSRDAWFAQHAALYGELGVMRCHLTSARGRSVKANN